MHQNKISIGGVSYNEGAAIYENNTEKLTSLLRLIDRFNSLVDLDKIIAEIGQVSQLLIDAQASLVMLKNKQTGEFDIKYCSKLIDIQSISRENSPNKLFTDWVLEHKLPLIANDINEQTKTGNELSQNFPIENLICVPIVDKEKNLLGIIEAINRYRPPKFTEADIPVFQELAQHAATSIKRVQACDEQIDQLKNQEIYLTEIHHRVKNDLALISGIVEIESLDLENEQAKQVLKSIQSRIKSMALVYELLSGEGSHTKADVGVYLEKLVNGVTTSFSHDKEITVNMEADTVVIDPYKALSCGLILNELLLNSYKYAFNYRNKGVIDIKLKNEGNTIFINYKDDGPGLAANFRISDQETIGFKMINALVNQLDGELLVHRGAGAHFEIRFETEDPEQPNSFDKNASQSQKNDTVNADF